MQWYYTGLDALIEYLDQIGLPDASEVALLFKQQPELLVFITVSFVIVWLLLIRGWALRLLRAIGVMLTPNTITLTSTEANYGNFGSQARCYFIALRKLGFAQRQCYRVAPFTDMKIMAFFKEGLVAVVYEQHGNSWYDLAARFPKGGGLTVTNQSALANTAIPDNNERFTVQEEPDAAYEFFKRRVQRLSISPIYPNNFAAVFTATYAEDVAWHKANPLK